MKNKTNITLFILLTCILVLIIYIVVSKPNVTIPEFNDALLRDSIAQQDSLINYWSTEYNKQKELASKYQAKVDSLEALKPDIHEKYDKQIKFNNSANILQLDSIIRSNWNN